jgi:hypothetical protein
MAESEAVSLGEDVEVQAVSRLVAAGVADRQGDPEAALALARRAAASVRGVEDLALRIECGLQVAQLAAATDRVDEVRTTIAEVSALARQKQSRLFERIVAEQAATLDRPGLR